MANTAPRDARQARNLDPAHVMDFSNLHLGHAPASKTVVTIVDMDVFVYGLEEIKDSKRPIAVACLSHGWANKAMHMEQMAYGVLGEARRLDKEGGRKVLRDMIVVTLDHRNHGARRRNPNGLVFANNPLRLSQAHATLVGGVQDFELVMDSLASYLWPRDERRIEEWMYTGVSLGGHLTWRMLRDDPRIRIGAPIVSIPPEYLAGILTRQFRVPPPDDPLNIIPSTVRNAFELQAAPGSYTNKKILSLHGAIDETIPVRVAKDEFVRIRGETGNLEVYVQDGMGHVVTPEMVKRVAEWFWRWGCCEQREAKL
ncbi:uncharacterized protein CcaverHIS019_0507420 [Cutaneotrichosporon cavernicola]|uniref:Alpha/beta-hydrolase n=1 Tax=Cutaneotrichosporon cavernicola TaxID=279322 RepID=A0AA48L6Y9_9TREE|nr:uncharacterized protein CcaverHIS019_0507420 [Cutaneotrichosporon cavernicola]BEI93114.1 hypothetical protein CcaverHIS019_0507420 [Cutaneotrichosporon cavernicola]BEJ00891.1 hypothetical protein CcaverHIS631_0507480 [Cutaneotrichosporon cavernicola]BEJ08657.1 hypothetical protein CcaverHIS641_0507510 [Cutaneotrichosporon cavernicola]